MNPTATVPPLSPRRVVLLGALATGILSAFSNLGIFCSCFFGLAGILGGWFALRLYFRSGGRAGVGRAAWLGLYGAALGTLAAMALHLFMGDFSPTHEDLQVMMEQVRKYLSENGKPPGEVEKEVQALWPVLTASMRWIPLFLVLLNSAGGAGGGALAALFAAAKGKDGSPPQDSSRGSSSRIEQ